MSNRNPSFLKRFKTQKTERNTNLLGCRPCNKTPTSRAENSRRSPVRLEDGYQKIQLVSKQNYLLKCVNHVEKNALFEPKDSLEQAYCQDCSLKLVKYNIRMLKVSEQTLCLRALYESEIQKLLQHQEEATELVQKYFRTQREIVRLAFLQAKESNDRTRSIPSFRVQSLKQAQLSGKLKQVLGSVQFRKIEFRERSQEQEKTQCLQLKCEGKVGSVECAVGSTNNNQNINQLNLERKQNLLEGRAKRMLSKGGNKSPCLR